MVTTAPGHPHLQRPEQADLHVSWRFRTTPRVSFEGTETSTDLVPVPSIRSIVRVVQAPMWIWSPALSGRRSLAGMGSWSALRKVPFVDPLVDQGPTPIGLAHKDGMAVGHTHVLRVGQRGRSPVQSLSCAAPPDADVVAVERDPTRVHPLAGNSIPSGSIMS